jgi:aminoglycoside 3-N-acetyltransferase I
MSSPIVMKVLTAEDLPLLTQLLDMFGIAFNETETYSAAQPSRDYMLSLLRDDRFIALVAMADGVVAGVFAGYLLRKFEQERSEFYLYDLAVAEQFRRRGIASQLIERLKVVAKERGAYVIFVQADLADESAVALYQKFGEGQQVLQFDIEV